jgi:hypothetical protein
MHARTTAFVLASTLATALGAVSVAHADTIMFKDGTQVEGTVVEQKEGQYVVVESAGGSKETIPWSQVKRVVLSPGHTVAAKADGTQAAQPASPTETTTTASATTTTAAPAATTTPEASATPATASGSGVRTHDGFYFRAGLGVALFAGGKVTPQAGILKGQDVDVSGAGPALELAFGGTLANGLVIGGGIYGASIPSPSYSVSGTTVGGGAAVISTIGPFIDWYVDKTSGFHVEASLGYAVISAAEGKDSPKFPPKDQSGSGYSLLAGAGYEWWVGDQLSMGVLGRLQYVSGSVKGSGDTSSTDVVVIIPALLATLTYH